MGAAFCLKHQVPGLTKIGIYPEYHTHPFIQQIYVEQYLYACFWVYYSKDKIPALKLQSSEGRNNLSTENYDTVLHLWPGGGESQGKLP